jgi:TonB family protein
MNTLLLYIIKVSIFLAGLYIIYSMFLSRDTMYGRNRLFILLSVLISFILPLITIVTKEPVEMQVFGSKLSEVLITNVPGSATPGDIVKSGWQVPIHLVYLAGVLFSAGLFLNSLLRIVKLGSEARGKGEKVVVMPGLGTAAFSAMGLIFIRQGLDTEEEREIQIHEEKHIEMGHFNDLLFTGCVKVILWFNPFIYLFERSLRAVHEYQADQGCINRGVSTVRYQRLLLNQVFGTGVFAFTNSFSNKALLKKRMIMMTKKRSGMPANIKLIFVLPVLAAAMLAFSACRDKSIQTTDAVELGVPVPENPSSPSQSSPSPSPPPPPPPPPYTIKDGDTSWIVVDEMPMYRINGGDDSLLAYIAEKTNYPPSAKDRGAQGRVVVRFTVAADGSVGSASIIKGADPDLDAEALRVVKSLPDFEVPGYHNDKPVSVWYMVPITFQLR